LQLRESRRLIWKANWQGMSSARGLLLIFALAACSQAATPTRLPTLTLIPPTPTSTSTPVTPTVTPANLPAPADLVTPEADTGSVLIPAQAEPLLERALSHLSERLGVGEDDIQLVRFETAVWTSLDLGCGREASSSLASLEIDGFRFVLAHEDDIFEYHSDRRTSVRLCEGMDEIAGRTELLLDTDPVAVELVGLARRRLAEQLDLAVRRIRLVDVTPHTWSDSSLGCPQPGETYPPILIEGYRIVLAAGDNEYVFHTDSTQLVPCEAGNEQLPQTGAGSG